MPYQIMDKRKIKLVSRSYLNTSLIVKRNIFQTDGRNEIWLKDSLRIIPYKIECSNCEIGEGSIEMTEEFIKSCYCHDNGIPKNNNEHNIKIDGGGHFHAYLECENCESIYYIGFGQIEPNHSRDVIVLHCIWEVEN